MTADRLEEYRGKRDFARTAEPSGDGAHARSCADAFVVQKHDARRLHWDFRLEIGGAMASWAVTRGPSLDPADKRLAVRTEDHPLDYAAFEGTIPAGAYGGGTVMVWDRGTWMPVEGKDPVKGLAEGHLHFTLAGKRMQGEWLLVRMKGKPGEKRENWLLRKVDDRFAGAGARLVEQALTSVDTGRTMAEIAAGKAGHAPRAKAGPRRKKETAKSKAGAKVSVDPPPFEPVQLATLVDRLPTQGRWFYETKFDGYRALIAASGGDVHVYTRSGLDWTDRFPALVPHIRALDLPPCLIDGEIVAVDADGRSDFSALQRVLKRGHATVKDDILSFHAFDLLSLEGEDMKPLPQWQRKHRLRALLAGAEPPVHLATDAEGGGAQLLDGLCRAGQEGLMCKRADARYAGGRTRNWLKVKCVRRQEFVIVGWIPSKAKGRPFASLLLAQHGEAGLLYRGKVGTGFDEGGFDDMAPRLAARERKSAPLDVAPADRRGARWVEPDLVAEVAYAELTAEGRVRHASFLGLRLDKSARDVVPETPLPVGEAQEPDTAGVRITHPERVVFADAGITKGQVAEYYAAVAPFILPHLAGRPVSLVRCPQGIAGKCFFQKHAGTSFGEEVGRVPIREKDGGSADYMVVSDAAGLLACVQMGTIEFHGWCARAPNVERPDRMIFDLDPDEKLPFAEVRHAARDVRDRLADLGLVSFAMLSGGKGIHVVVPLNPGHVWRDHADFAHRFAEAISRTQPDRYVATMAKARRKGRIFIDWLRNQRGSTAIMPWSVRARVGAPVAVPVNWDDLDRFDSANLFTLSDQAGIMARAADPALAGWGQADQVLPSV